MSFQENLRYYREKAGYTTKDFAKMLNLPYATYAGYEYKNREPKYEVLCNIAELLNVSTDELLGRENNLLGNKEDEKLIKLINDLFNQEYDKDSLMIVAIHKVLKVTDKQIEFNGMIIDKQPLIDYLNGLMLEHKKIIAKDFSKRINNLWFLKFLFDNNIKEFNDDELSELNKFNVIIPKNETKK